MFVLLPIGGKIKPPESVAKYGKNLLKEHPKSPWCLWARYEIAHEKLLRCIRSRPAFLMKSGVYAKGDSGPAEEGEWELFLEGCMDSRYPGRVYFQEVSFAARSLRR